MEKEDTNWPSPVSNLLKLKQNLWNISIAKKSIQTFKASSSFGCSWNLMCNLRFSLFNYPIHAQIGLKFNFFMI